METLARLEAGIAARGLSVFARIDHAALAAGAGLSLRPTTVVLFGNPKGGTPLMQAAQTMGIDLPLKALVWQDEAGATWISYNEPKWLALRHQLPGADAIVEKLTGAVAAVAAEAAGSALLDSS